MPAGGHADERIIFRAAAFSLMKGKVCKKIREEGSRKRRIPMAYSAEQVKAYLARIGLSGELPLTAETLTRIVSAHYQTVPYENLFILSGTPLDLSPEALFQKIVLEHRGGFCFELNAALGELLEGLGFSVTHLAARFLRGEPEGIPMRRHHILLVHLPEGDYLCDAGIMREASRRALPLVYDRTFSDGMGEYRFQKDPFYGTVLLQRLSEPEFVPFFGFTMEPQIPADYVMPCFYCEKHPDSPFIKDYMVGIYTEKGSWNLVGHSLRRLENGWIAEQRELTEKELSGVLEARFGIPEGK